MAFRKRGRRRSFRAGRRPMRRRRSFKRKFGPPRVGIRM